MDRDEQNQAGDKKGHLGMLLPGQYTILARNRRPQPFVGLRCQEQYESQTSTVGIICSNGGSGRASGTDRRKVPSGAGPGHRSLHRQHDSE